MALAPNSATRALSLEHRLANTREGENRLCNSMLHPSIIAWLVAMIKPLISIRRLIVTSPFSYTRSDLRLPRWGM